MQCFWGTTWSLGVRDIIPGYHSETIQKMEMGAHYDLDRAQSQLTMII